MAPQKSLWCAFLVSLVMTLPSTSGQDIPATEEDPLHWQHGPTRAQMGDLAEVDIPAGFQFTGKEGCQLLLQAMQNTVDGSELGIIMPQAEDADWFVVFEFSEIGYVKDDDKDKLDAAAILDSIRQGTEAGNRERRSRGWPEMKVIGWEVPPQYDPATNNLEWAIRAESEGSPILNYNMRILGRRGVMEANLVVDPEDLSEVLPTFRSLISGYRYTSGQKYAEFRAGDKIAQYGLTALVAGGAAGLALKTGLFKKFGKLIVVGVLGIGAAIKKLFGRGKAVEAH